MESETHIEWYDSITGQWFIHHTDCKDRAHALSIIEGWRNDPFELNLRHRVVTIEEV